MPTDEVHYTVPAVFLHWLMALLLAGLFSLGLYMADLPVSPGKLKLYSWHKWGGVTAFLLVWVRLAWRWSHPPPELPHGLSRLNRFWAEAVHRLLYLLMIAVPLSGWLMSSAKGLQTVYFGVLPIPDLLGKDKSLGDLLLIVHQSLNFVLAACVLAHAGAALKHHLIDRDEVLRRMLPFLRPS